ncbi:AlpA family transcriptional regulator [Aquipseudomonas alcaligenes]|nr:AlpA family transcriptional regulator [Pseudomonas alcaligenes]
MPITQPPTKPNRFIKLAAVREYTSLSTSEIYRRIAAGTFPTQVTLGPKSVAWVESEILQWCDALAAQRGEAA